MAHVELREMAFQMRSEDLREYGKKVLERDPQRTAAYEVLDLMAYLVACDFVGAEAKLETIKFKFKGTRDEEYVESAMVLAQCHIDFAFGRFNNLEINANNFLKNLDDNSKIQLGEHLDILRLLAQKHFIMDEFEKLEQINLKASKIKVESSNTNELFLINSIKAMTFLAEGNFFKAQELAKRNIAIARQNNYSGLMAPVDSLYVLANTYYALAKGPESIKSFKEIIEVAANYSLWAWHLIADGYISRDFAQNGDISDALECVRNERKLLADFEFKHDLNFIPDVNELYVRFLVNDVDRIEVLLNRVPKLNLVKQIEGFFQEIKGKDMLNHIQTLPDKTPREKLYKLLALADYYSDKESIALEYMMQALQVVEEFGFIEMLLRQLDQLDLVVKAVAKKPTVFLEDIASKMTERARAKHQRNRGNTPLTVRELEIVKHLATGRPISQIGGSLHVSMNTMKTHLRNIYRKLEVDGREKAVEKAKELFLI